MLDIIIILHYINMDYIILYYIILYYRQRESARVEHQQFPDSSTTRVGF